MDNLGIKEIAQLAGVSIGTVDRVLHSRSGVAEKTRLKVLKIIKEKGYKKNIIASRLKLAGIKKINIAILFPEINNEWSYWKLPQKGITKAVDELKEQGISIKYFYFDLNKATSFSLQIEYIFQQKFDAIITVPFLDKESNQLLQLARKRKKKVVFLDTERPLNFPSNYIRQNSFNSGKVAGRLLYGLTAKKGIYFIINILTERGIQINNQQREQGFRSFFTENLKNEHVIIHTINQAFDKNINFPNKFIQLLKNAPSKGIFVTNARSYLLVPILKDLNIENTFIVGYDINHKNLAYLNSGDIDFLINQKPEYQGYAAVKGLYKYFTQKDNSELNIDIPVEIIVKENANALKELP